MVELLAALSTLVTQFGSAGGLAVAFSLYFLHILQKKLDDIVIVNSKMFAVLMTIARKTDKDVESK